MLLLSLSLPASAQAVDDVRPPQSSAAEASEIGVRFTPAMARAIAGRFTNDMLVRRYELDDDRKEEAAEAIARRLMALAHANAPEGRELFEYGFAESLRSAIDGSDEQRRQMLQGMAQRVTPVLPAVRELVADVGRDVRPMLPLKQQFKLATDIMAATTAMEALEKNMQRWARGHVDETANPFQSEDTPIELDEAGESKALSRARQFAEREASAAGTGEWPTYVEQAKSFYLFDQSQAAVADSILREYTDRAHALIRDEFRLDELYRSRLWARMARELRLEGHTVLEHMAETRLALATEPVQLLEQEFKQRIDAIATEAQRAAADARMIQLLAERGFSLDH